MNAVEFDRALQLVERRHPHASVLYARIILALSRARNREMLQSDLSDQIGKGRDHTAVQNATARLVDLGIATREMEQTPDGGRVWLVRLAKPDAWPLS